MAIKVVTTADYVGLTSGFPNTNGPLTVMHWTKVGTLQTEANGVSLSNATFDCWNIFISPVAGIARYKLNSHPGGAPQGIAPLSFGVWYSLAFTVSSGGVANSFVNGVPDLTSVTVSTDQTPAGLQVGAAVSSGGGMVDQEFYGLKIWNAELTAAEVAVEDSSYSAIRTANLYGHWLLSNVTSLADDSGNGHHFTRNGTSFTNSADPQAKDVLATATAGWIQG